jgi:hypothetical protein
VEKDAEENEDFHDRVDRDTTGVKRLIKSTLSGLGVKTPSSNKPKNAIAAFSKIMEDRIQEQKETDDRRLRFEEMKFQTMLLTEEKKSIIDKEKVIILIIIFTKCFILIH